jgi:small-conductance mechanosensitive channel
MNFWSNVQAAAFITQGRYLVWLVLGFYLAAVALYLYVPGARRRVRAAALLFALALVGLLVAAAVVPNAAQPETAAQRWILWLPRFIFIVAIINLTSVVVFDVLLTAARLRPARIMIDLILAVGYIVAGLTLLTESGFNLNGIIVTSTVITAAVAFSLQDTLGNIMGGLALQTERTISVGDWVRIGPDEGQIKEIRWRQTSIETRNWDTIVIPNSVLMRSQVVLMGHRTGAPRQQRRWVYFHVDFRYAPSDVIATVEAALRVEHIEHVAHEPAPHCILVDFKDSYGYYAARYWITDLGPTDPTDSVVRHRIFFALRRAGIPLSIPAHMIFVEEDSEARRARKRGEEIARRADALRNCELFAPLTEQERAEIAARLNLAPFVRGEVITKQGAVAHWLYIIRKGEAEVRVTAPGSDLSERVATLRDGDFFGEMGLLTGAPRTATLIALTDIECYRLDKEGFDEVLQRRPEIAQDLARVLARRRVELDAILGELSEEAERQSMSHMHTDMLDRIRRFFKLDSGRNGG